MASASATPIFSMLWMGRNSGRARAGSGRSVPQIAAAQRIVQAACGRGGGRIRFKVAKGSVGIGTLSYMGDDPKHERRIAREGGTIEEIEVPLLTLDEIVGDRIEKIDLLSIDVEGAELQVLQER